MYWTSFATDRLIARHLRRGDETYIFPEVDARLTEHWIGWEPPNDIEEQITRIEALMNLMSQIDWCAYFLMFMKDTDEFVGACGITPVMESTFHKPEDVEFDIWIKHSAQKQGYASEAMLGLIQWGQKNTIFPYIIYSITEGNISSMRLLEKLWKSELVGSEILTKRGESRRVFDYKIILKD